MSKHLTRTQIEDYGRRPLAAAEWLFVSDHLTGCEICRRQVQEAVDTETTYLTLKSGVFDQADSFSLPAERTHLTFEEIAGFVNEAITIEELQVIRDHLAWCENCEEAVDDLRAFKDQVAPEIERESRRSPVSAATESSWRHLLTAISAFWAKSPLIFGSAVAILLLTAIGFVGWQALQGTRAGPGVAVTGPSPSVSPSSLPASVPEGATPVIIARLNDGGGEVALSREGKLSGLDQLSPAHRRMVERALADQAIERSPILEELKQLRITPRGDRDNRGGKFSLIAPVGEVILPDHPIFRWTQLDGAAGYVVEIYDERFNLMTTSPQVTDHSWTSAQALQRGGIYYWQVKAIKDGNEVKSPRPPEPQAKFRILDGAKAEELAKARRTYASSHLTLGLLYAQAGVLHEAGLEFQALLKANSDSPLAHRLLRQIRTKP